jgi:hypothetical protein
LFTVLFTSERACIYIIAPAAALCATFLAWVERASEPLILYTRRGAPSLPARIKQDCFYLRSIFQRHYFSLSRKRTQNSSSFSPARSLLWVSESKLVALMKATFVLIFLNALVRNFSLLFFNTLGLLRFKSWLARSTLFSIEQFNNNNLVSLLLTK